MMDHGPPNSVVYEKCGEGQAGPVRVLHWIVIYELWAPIERQECLRASISLLVLRFGMSHDKFLAWEVVSRLANCA